MSFKKPEVAAKYELAGDDQKIIAPKFTGMLSEAPLAVVEGLVARNTNLVRSKAPVTSSKPERAA